MRGVVALLFCAALCAQVPSPAEQSAALDAIRLYAQTYTQSLPDFMAAQTTRRDIRPMRRERFLPTVRAQTDIVEEEIRYTGRREIHRTTRVNGQAIPNADTEEKGIFSHGEFGALLAIIFDPASGAEFHWNRLTTRDRRRAYVFDFTVPAHPFGYSILEGSRVTVVGFHGSIYADLESKAVQRIQMTCTGIPSSSEYRHLELSVDYGPKMIAGHQFMLPERYTLNAERDDATMVIEGRYRNYRRFATESSLVPEDVRQ
jgi:hypothetical protein